MATLFSRPIPATTNQPVTEGEVVTSSDPLTPHIRGFLHGLSQSYTHTPSTAEGTIRVSEVFGVIALVYEKIRGAIDYKREHLIRRNAIERILKRLLWERQGRDLPTTSHLLLRELIWAHYLPNDHVSKNSIQVISKIIQKYLDVINLLGGWNSVSSEHRGWLLGVCSCDIEEELDGSKRELYVELMYSWFKTHFSWEGTHLTEQEKDLQLYLAIHRALPKSDEAIMRYHLLIKEFPQWIDPSQNDVLKISQNFSKLHAAVERHLVHPIHLPLFRYVKKYAAPFEILREVVGATGRDFPLFVGNPSDLELKIREVCQVRYAQIRAKVNIGIIRSIIYIFVTKVLIALAVEVPYELFVYGHLVLIPISINIILPPALMFLLGLTIKTPNERNTLRLIERISSLVYHSHQTSRLPFHLNQQSNRTLLTSVFSLMYLFLFFITFGGISYVLYQIGFSYVSGIIFFVFLSLVLLFGYRVRATATELSVTGDRDNIFSYILSNLSLPFLNLGVILSKTVSKLNVFIIIMDFLIEAPLKTIIEVIEEWTTFVRQKREEVIDIPPE